MKRPRYFCTRLQTCGRGLELDETDPDPVAAYGLVCSHCGAPVFDEWAMWFSLLKPVLFVLSAVIVALLLSLLLTGCAGAPFTAGEALELQGGGSGGALQTSQGPGGAAGAPSILPAVGGSAGAGGELDGAPTAGAGTLTACELAGGTAAAFASWTSGDGGPPSSAIDGSSSTRWASGVPQAVGQWFEVTLQAPLELERLVLASRASDAPALVTLELDGVTVPTTQSTAPGQFTLDFAPHRTTVIRLEVEQASTSWWSIDELTAECQP